MKAYEQCISATSTATAPWHVVPADDKDTARLIVYQILLDALRGLDVGFPQADAARHKELLGFRERLQG